jgi:GTP-dependent dephospho-CoA kinase
MRPKLAKPIGRLFTPETMKSPAFERLVREAPMVITVGDRVTEMLGKLGRPPDVQVVDGKENRILRKPPDVPFARLIEVENAPGTLTTDAINGLRAAFDGKKPVRVMVHGEEDLLAIPVISLAPVSAIVFYGQPGEGMVAVKSDARSKSRNRAILAEIGVPEIR